MTSSMTRSAALASWGCQLAAAGILAQTLFFKFTGAEESRFIFSTLGVEPWGRIASGVRGRRSRIRRSQGRLERAALAGLAPRRAGGGLSRCRPRPGLMLKR